MSKNLRKGFRFDRWRIEIAGDYAVTDRVPCVCRCGTKRNVKLDALLRGNSRSCGCRRAVANRKRANPAGVSHHALYPRWRMMHARCYNPKHKHYDNYGGRGIIVDARWHGATGFRNFVTDMGPLTSNDTLERRNNDESYSPKNCYWASRTTQNRNRRDNRLLTINGETKCLAAWAEKCVHGAELFGLRIKRGWDPQRAMQTPPYNRGQTKPSAA